MRSCWICGSDMKPYFKKKFGKDTHEYIKCPKCGLVLSDTLYSMKTTEWEMYNTENHKSYHDNYTVPEEDTIDPKWLQRLHTQSKVLAELFEKGIFSDDLKVLDYGCGDGKLSDFFREEYKGKVRINKYDKYMSKVLKGIDYLDDSKLNDKWDIVINCSVMEHLIGRDELDKIMNLIEPQKGIMIMHTLVCEEIPFDPDWFYLLPGHCTLYSNEAMKKLFEQYGFKGCVYNVESQFWFLFKDLELYESFKAKSEKLEGTWVFNDSFVDYWKQKPYRKS